MSTETTTEINHLVAGQTAPKLFLRTVAEHGDLVAVRSMNGDGWNEWSYRDLAAKVAQAAAGLRALGVGPGQRVLLMMRNRPDFHWLDIAAQFLRATPVSIYNSSSPEEIQYLADKHGKMTFKPGTIDRAHQDSFTQFAVDDVESPLWFAAKHSFALPEEYRVADVKRTGVTVELAEARLGLGHRTLARTSS